MRVSSSSVVQEGRGICLALLFARGNCVKAISVRLSATLVALICATVVSLALGQTEVREQRVALSRHTQTKRRRGKQGGYANLVAQLRAKRATVKPSSERVSQPFFSVRGRILMVNGQAAQVFEFANAATAAAETKRVGATATTSVAWIAPPHFFHSGRLIVLYVGDNESILKLLTTELGPQFAGQ